MMNCHQATRLISQQQERELSMKERLTLHMHLAMCSGCRNFRLQVPFLSRAMRAYSERLDTVLDEAGNASATPKNHPPGHR